jgi:hypothetical protein
VTITEPATLVTDWVMAGLAAWFAARLCRRDTPHAGWWSGAFALTAASALVGGAHHGFHEALPPWASDALWRASLAAASIASYATMRAAAVQWLSSAAQPAASRAALVKLGAALVAGVLHPAFLVVVLDFGATLLFLGGAAAAGRRRDPRACAAAMAGLALFVGGAAVQQGGLSPSPSFNHNDLFHVVQILANACFFVSAGGARSRPV